MQNLRKDTQQKYAEAEELHFEPVTNPPAKVPPKPSISAVKALAQTIRQHRPKVHIYDIGELFWALCMAVLGTLFSLVLLVGWLAVIALLAVKERFDNSRRTIAHQPDTDDPTPPIPTPPEASGTPPNIIINNIQINKE